MYTKSLFWSSLLGATVACSLFAGGIAAAEHPVTLAIQVDTAGLDPSRPVDAQMLYSRLQRAATQVCSSNYRVGLAPVAEPRACYEKAFADAIRDAKQPLLTQLYLATHTPQQAAAHGIDAPSHLASR